MIAGLLGQMAAVLVPAVRKSRAGDTVADWSSPVEVAVVRCALQPRTSSGSESERDARGQRGVAYFEVGAPINSLTRIVVGSRTWQVVGPPRIVSTPHGPHHMVADVAWIEG